MVNHAIVLTSCEWVDAAKEGNIKVFEFIKGRKRGIKALGPGSVALVACKREDLGWVFTGEFKVKEVKKIYSREYRELAKNGKLLGRQELKPREYIWGLIFEKFIKYPREVPQKSLTHLKSSTSSKPVSDWVLTGLTYLHEEDIQLIEGVREKAFPIPYLYEKLMELEKRVKELEEKVK